jgi:two-component system cell cycle response regulator DivK
VLDASPLALIVDDNPGNLKLAADVLLAAGFHILQASSGREAVALATEHRPDVILMDLRLPDMDGTEAARELAEDARTEAIPVVGLSALALPDDGAELMGAGFAGYLEKPIDIRTFPDQVRSYCRS